MVYGKQTLSICAVFSLLSLLQLGRIVAGNMLESGGFVESVMHFIGPMVGFVGFFTCLLTFPLMFVLGPLNDLFGTSLVFALVYMLVGIIVITSKLFKGLAKGSNNRTLLVYLTSFSIFQFIFDYSWKINDNRIAAGQIRPDAFDGMWMMMYFSFSVLVSIIASIAFTEPMKRKQYS